MYDVHYNGVSSEEMEYDEVCTCGAETVCLPEYVKPTDVVSTRLVQTDGGTLSSKKLLSSKN